MPASSGRGGA
ncbi:hypothetical protein YPPY34_1142, partial [Yersinia pestis PY-34]